MAQAQPGNVNVQSSSIQEGHFGCNIQHTNIYNNPVFIQSQQEQNTDDSSEAAGSESNVKRLTETITADTSKPLSKKAHVYPGEQTMGGLIPPRLVAIKVVRYSDKKMREAQNLLKLTPHVNVVSIVHADLIPKSFEKRIYIVMERCYPLTLEHYIKNRKAAKVPFNPVIALELTKQIVEGINHIHKNNIIHRDLKPGSVLFSRCGRFLKIIDFGVSKELRNGFTVMSLSTLPIGTDGYRAPETYNRNEIKKQADIFSLGILLYHVWSNGCHPFGPGPEIWSFNIKEHNEPEFSKLLIPEADSAVGLLKSMFKVEPEERITIDDVKAHPIISLTTEAIVKTVINPIWDGPIQLADSKESFPDNFLFVDKTGPPVEMLNAQSTLQMIYVPSVATKKFSLPVDKKPDGYLAMRKPCFKKLNDKILEDDMAWINIFDEDGERSGILLVVHPKEYDIYGVFVKNPDEFASGLAGHISQDQETTPKEIDEADEELESQPEVMQQSDNRLNDAIKQDKMITPSRQLDVEPEQPTAGDADTDMPEEPTPVKQTSNEPPPRSTGQPEFIPWWIHEV